ncbi:MAG: PPOX class F420-dependent oxidoreductase [Nitrospinota bacterium]
MSQAQQFIESFLAKPLMARIAVTRKDGQPYQKPLWYVYEDGKFLISTGTTGIHTRCLRRDPRVSICIDNPEAPYQGVMVEGVAEIRENMGKDHELIGRLAERYLGKEMGAKYMQGPIAQKERVRVYVTPRRWIIWDNRATPPIPPGPPR